MLDVQGRNVLDDDSIPVRPSHQLQTTIGLRRLSWAFRLMLLSTILTIISGALVVNGFLGADVSLTDEVPDEILVGLALAGTLYSASYLVRFLMAIFWIYGMSAINRGKHELGPLHQRRIESGFGTMKASAMVIILGTMVGSVSSMLLTGQSATVGALKVSLLIEFVFYSIGTFLLMYGHDQLITHLASPASRERMALSLRLNLASIALIPVK